MGVGDKEYCLFSDSITTLNTCPSENMMSFDIFDMFVHILMLSLKY